MMQTTVFGSPAQGPSCMGVGAYAFRPRRALPLPSRNRPGVAILGVVDTTCAKLVAACQFHGLYYKIFSDAAALLSDAGRSVLSLVLVQPGAVDVPQRHLLDFLRSGEFRRMVLVGPSLGESEYLRALEAGFDEVWPETLPSAALPVLVSKAWQTSRQLPSTACERVLSLGGLVLSANSCSCSAAGHTAYLGRVCFAILQCLALHYPGTASREKLALATRNDASGLGNPSRAMDVAVSRLRRKLQDAGIMGIRIQSISGMGYQLCMESAGMGQSGLQVAA